MSGARSALRVLVKGHVQDVGFRWRTQAFAARAGLSGWVKNLPNGQVEIRAEGAREALEALQVWLRGPEAPGRVEALEVEPAELSDERAAGFSIRR